MVTPFRDLMVTQDYPDTLEELDQGDFKDLQVSRDVMDATEDRLDSHFTDIIAYIIIIRTNSHTLVNTILIKFGSTV